MAALQLVSREAAVANLWRPGRGVKHARTVAAFGCRNGGGRMVVLDANRTEPYSIGESAAQSLRRRFIC